MQGTGEIWIDDGDMHVVAPTLIVHYVEQHAYRPPTRFIRAAAQAADHRRRNRPQSWAPPVLIDAE
ncbi:MAG: hypothetical protein Q7T55_00820 [Solirubrobacteraceae bacterium]|nr:hypothetical protein [Solirubrobacteraceae bacterium]